MGVTHIHSTFQTKAIVLGKALLLLHRSLIDIWCFYCISLHCV